MGSVFTRNRTMADWFSLGEELAAVLEDEFEKEDGELTTDSPWLMIKTDGEAWIMSLDHEHFELLGTLISP